MSKVIIAGAGAAGMMAAYAAAKNGHEVTILERNEKCGKKIYITGKGRCNVTNDCDILDFFDKIVTNSKFMYSALYGFTNYQTMELFTEEFGLKLKTERGGRVFPMSDKSSDVISALTRALKKLNVDTKLNTRITDVLIENGTVKGVKANNRIYDADAVIIATGGLSYPSTGSDGDGYTFAKAAGHTIKQTSPGLVPMVAKENWVKELQGLALKNVTAEYYQNGKKLYSEFGEMLFTHFGVSGPLILTASSYIGNYLAKGNVTLCIDCKPALSHDELEQRILRDFEAQTNVQFKNSLGKLLPRKLIPVVVELSEIKSDKPVNSVTREERIRLAGVIKKLQVTITGFRDYNEAIITRGGVNVKEINPSTLESKLCKNLYFAGEVLDIDAVTGGYNLQIAWSTGYLAGSSI